MSDGEYIVGQHGIVCIRSSNIRHCIDDVLMHSIQAVDEEALPVHARVLMQLEDAPYYVGEPEYFEWTFSPLYALPSCQSIHVQPWTVGPSTFHGEVSDSLYTKVLHSCLRVPALIGEHV
jgi:hypothetical protein